MESMECPHCGTPVPTQRICCAACGSDLDTGWKDPGEIEYHSVEIPEDDLRSATDSDEHKSRMKSIGLLLALFIATPVFLIDNPLQVLMVWFLLGLLLGVRKTLDTNQDSST